MTITNVKAHTRGKEDPFKPVMEARKARFCRKWRVEAEDARPVDPATGGPSLASIAAKLADLAKAWKRIGE